MTDTPAAASPPSIKQAVVLVHGMGDQVPMQTLRSFVETMWVRNPDIVARDAKDPARSNPVWWKPDQRTGSFDLSRITTRAGHQSANAPEGPRTDFFEFYWADLTDANTIEQLQDWFMSLLWRKWSQVPKNVKSVWLILWALTLFFGGLAVWATLAKIFCPNGAPPWVVATLAVAAVVWAIAHAAVLGTFGDVARYVRAKPANIAARQAIRDRGLKLLREISDSQQYSRIILVGHSLGSIIAYDLVKLFWSERDAARTMQQGDALYQACRACAAAGECLRGDEPETLTRYRSAQRQTFGAMQGRGGTQGPWLISDFVTVGSPLSHAQFLLERDAPHLRIGVEERRFPISPPVAEDDNGFLYQPHRRTDPNVWSMHHAAPFAAVAWSNLYDKARAIVFGDLISGPVRDNFHSGIDDIRVTIRRPGSIFSRFFTHTSYWTDTGDPSHLEALRRALDLTR